MEPLEDLSLTLAQTLLELLTLLGELYMPRDCRDELDQLLSLVRTSIEHFAEIKASRALELAIANIRRALLPH
jgi:hypothetical protein